MAYSRLTWIRTTALGVVVAAMGFAVNSRGGLIPIHQGDADPVSEGWSVEPGLGGGVSVGPVDDGGTPAWAVDDNGTLQGTTWLYTQTVAAEQAAAGNQHGWTLQTTIRVASDESPEFDGSPVVAYRDGAHTWQMNFGLADGDTVVRLYTGVTSGPTYTVPGNDAYNSFSLHYDPLMGSADLYVNGIEVLSDYIGEVNTQMQILWGSGRSPDQGQGNFNLVSFEVIPEPTSAALLVLGIGLLWTARRSQA